MLDVNVHIAALLTRDGVPGRLLLRWLGGDFELIISGRLLSELARALSYPRVRSRVPDSDASAYIELLQATATIALDPRRPGRRSRDAGDDYLLALAESCAAVIVSGDRDLLDLGGELPTYSPADFLAMLDR